MVQINWTIQAKSDLKNIASFVAKDSKVYSQRLINRIIDCTSILNTHPLIGKRIEELLAIDLREINMGNYRIIYKIVSLYKIDIITIHHSKRNLVTRNL